MNIAILGTGIVGRTLAEFLSNAGHRVTVGTRNVTETLSKPALSSWSLQHSTVDLKAFEEAAIGAEIVINATHGMASIQALSSVGNENLDGKILVDLANSLDDSNGAPPFLGVSNTDSLGEQIQRHFPQARVVKTLNTVGAPFMVNPGLLPEGQPTIFVSGNDDSARTQVVRILKDWFGWTDVLDLGDITTARGPEMSMALWVRVWGALKTPFFGFHLLK